MVLDVHLQLVILLLDPCLFLLHLPGISVAFFDVVLQLPTLIILLFILLFDRVQLLLQLGILRHLVVVVALIFVGLRLEAIQLTLLVPDLNLQVLVLLAKSIWLILLLLVLRMQLLIFFLLIILDFLEVGDLLLERATLAILLLDGLLVARDLSMHVLYELLVPLDLRDESRLLLGLAIGDGLLQLRLLLIQLLGLRPQLGDPVGDVVNLFLHFNHLIVELLEQGVVLCLLLLRLLQFEQLVG